MKHIRLGKRRRKFEVLVSSREAQAAVMALEPGQTSDGQVSNEHPKSEQWLLVLAGTGRARIKNAAGGSRSVKLSEQSLLLINKGEPHQITNTGRVPLLTINFYVPPAYQADGEVRAQAKKR